MHHWNDDVIVASHPNTQATAMSVDVSGQLALLGSRRHLSLIKLKEPKKVLRRINLNNKWDISKVAWNPFEANKQFFLTTYNQWTDLWQCNEVVGNRLTTFAGHTRAITDVDWSPVDCNLMATCSLDTYIYLWDMRETKKPKLATSTVSGASHVRWNKFNQYCIATSHDGNIRIWDLRNGKSPSQYITAHVSNINFLDWSSSNEHELSSAGQDKTICFWDTSELPRTPHHQIHVQYPVWRAEYTPFGTGMASIAFRSLRETPLALWNTNEVSQPVHVYNGHTDVVLDFQWIKCGAGNKWNLVTWAKDQTLRLWPADYGLLLACGELDDGNGRLEEDPLAYGDTSINESNVDQVAKQPSSVSSADTQASDGMLMHSATPDFSNELSLPLDNRVLASSPSSTTSKSRGPLSSSFVHNLEKEFKLVNVYLPNLIVNQMDQHRRLCTLTLRTSSQLLVLHIAFPHAYPQNEAPVFQFVDSSDNIDKESQEKLLKTLRETAQHHVKSNRSCLEPCLRQLTSQFSQMSYKVKEEYDSDSLYSSISFSHGFGLNSSFRSELHSIPFPRTSGARFCGAGYLVMFMRPTHVKGFQSSLGKTPRSFTSLLSHRNSAPVLPRVGFDKGYPVSTSQSIYGGGSSSSSSDFLVSSFYYKEKRASRKSYRYLYNPVAKESENLSTSSNVSVNQMRSHQSAGRVVIVDLTRILPISKALSLDYIVPDEYNYANACLHNKEKALLEEMDDLVQLWSCVSLLPKPNESNPYNEFSAPFSSSPLGRPFLSDLMDHYRKLKDVQTLAMLSLTFNTGYSSSPPEPPVKRSYSVTRSVSHSNFEQADVSFGFHKSPSESRFPDTGLAWFTNIIARSPTSESSIAKYIPSPSESPPDDYRFEEPLFAKTIPSDKEKWDAESQMLDSERESQFDSFKTAYCQLLERWQMYVKITEIQKHRSKLSAPPPHIIYKASCHACGEKCACICYKKPTVTAMRCNLCQLPVKHLASFCMKCYHGGHALHIRDWFKSKSSCPIPSCDCVCVITSKAP